MSHHLAVGETGLQLTCAHNRSVRLNDARLSGVDCTIVTISVIANCCLGNIWSGVPYDMVDVPNANLWFLLAMITIGQVSLI